MRSAWLLSIALIGACGYPNPAGGDAGDGSSVRPCETLDQICGSSGHASCCTSPLVAGNATGATNAGASFYRSWDVASDMMFSSYGMSFPATVSDFRLDTYEVTVGRFRQFVENGRGTQANPPPAGAGARSLNGSANQGGWDPSWNVNLSASTDVFETALSCNPMYQSWTTTRGSNAAEANPINCITWFEAFAFCVWDGGFLPTEAEWNYAAAGGSDQRAYPWSSPPSSVSIDCGHANYFVNPPNGYCVPNGTTGRVNPVGSESPAGDSKYGQADLAGNVWEWNLDAFQKPYTTPCTDCADLSDNQLRVARGGNDIDSSTYLRSANRYSGMSGMRYPNYGVRCARMP
jgi:formylglycine-generating enzyme required for sulfatase activity